MPPLPFDVAPSPYITKQVVQVECRALYKLYLLKPLLVHRWRWYKNEVAISKTVAAPAYKRFIAISGDMCDVGLNQLSMFRWFDNKNESHLKLQFKFN